MILILLSAVSASAETGQADPFIQSQIERLHGDPETRRSALLRLAHTGNPTVTPYLIASLTDNEPVIRATAATSIGNLKLTEGIPGLIRALDDKDLFVRKSAAYALGSFHDSNVTEALTAHLTIKMKKVKPADEAEFHVAIITALGQTGDETAAPVLLSHLEDPNSVIRAQSALSLGQLKSMQATSALIAHLQLDPDADVRRNAVQALGQIRTPEAKAALEAALNDKDLYVRRYAWQILHPK